MSSPSRASSAVPLTQVTTINEEMKVAAAYAIAGTVADEELSADYIIPSPFNRRVVEAVATAVAEAATKSGVTRRRS